MDPKNNVIGKEITAVVAQIRKNKRREKDTYSKMFQKDNSVAEFIEKELNTHEEEKKNYMTLTEKEEAEEQKKLDEKVKAFSAKKRNEFSFEVKEEMVDIPEINELDS